MAYTYGTSFIEIKNYDFYIRTATTQIDFGTTNTNALFTTALSSWTKLGAGEEKPSMTPSKAVEANLNTGTTKVAQEQLECVFNDLEVSAANTSHLRTTFNGVSCDICLWDTNAGTAGRAVVLYEVVPYIQPNRIGQDLEKNIITAIKRMGNIDDYYAEHDFAS